MDTDQHMSTTSPKILGHETYHSAMRRSTSDTPNPSAWAGAGNAGAIVFQKEPPTPPTSSLTEDSTSSLKDDSQPPTGPSLLLSDPNIPKSTYVSSSKRTTTAPSYTESVILSGQVESALSSQSEKSSPSLGYQESGDHYRKYPIQPTQYIVANGLGFLAGNVIKYTTRYKDKNGAEDIRKAIHYLKMILEFEYGKESKV